MKLGSKKVYVAMLAFVLMGHLMAEVKLSEVQSMGLIHYQKVDLFDDPYIAMVFNEKGFQVIELYNENKKVFQKKVSAVTDGLKKVDFSVFDNSEHPFAVIKLQKGVHGEQVLIISLAEGKEVYHQTSAWPVEVKINNKGVDITVVDESKKSSLKSWQP